MGCLLGFFFLPGYALMLSMCEETAGFQKAGAATGILMLMGNAGGVVLIILMPVVDAGHTFWTNSIYMMLALMAVTLALVIGPLKDTFLKEKATV